MKGLYALILMIGFATISFGQNDPQAKKVLDNVSAKMKTFKGVTANFTYTTKNKKNVKQGSVNGQISLKGQKYYIKQGNNLIISDGKKTWNYNGENEVMVGDVDNDSKTLTPQKLLSDFYDKDFTYKLVSSAGSFYEIQMTPTDKRKNFKQVNVFVDKAKSLITKAKIIDKSDNLVEFELKNVSTTANLPDSKFVFDTKKYPKVEVIEQ
jgi:outer membrane lipoprotein carrier protein